KEVKVVLATLDEAGMDRGTCLAAWCDAGNGRHLAHVATVPGKKGPFHPQRADGLSGVVAEHQGEADGLADGDTLGAARLDPYTGEAVHPGGEEGCGEHAGCRGPEEVRIGAGHVEAQKARDEAQSREEAAFAREGFVQEEYGRQHPEPAAATEAVAAV